jgi:hypothetical protein
MLIGLTKAMRVPAASVLALVYLLCVLAPAAAFAFGDGKRAAHCLTDDNHGLTSVHVHEHDGKVHSHADGTVHVHEDGSSHEHSQAPGKSSDAQCCGLICLSALPADGLEVVAPILPTMIVVCANQADLAGKPPDRLYRPPISPLSL